MKEGFRRGPWDLELCFPIPPGLVNLCEETPGTGGGGVNPALRPMLPHCACSESSSTHLGACRGRHAITSSEAVLGTRAQTGPP